MAIVGGTRTSDATSADPRSPSWPRWIVLCAAAETVGMAAASGASRLTTAWVGEPNTVRDGAAAIGLAAGAGLVEGLALGTAQAVGLASYLPGTRRRRWVVTTASVAVVGWALASVPSAFATDGGAEPPRLLMVAGGAGLGAVLGLLLGASQSLVLRGSVPRPGRWVLASVLGWVPVMTVMFLGASTPEASWTSGEVVALGALTGAVAGALLGVVTGLFVTNGRLRRTRPPVRG